jgi:hypothetical protein
MITVSARALFVASLGCGALQVLRGQLDVPVAAVALGEHLLGGLLAHRGEGAGGDRLGEQVSGGGIVAARAARTVEGQGSAHSADPSGPRITLAHDLLAGRIYHMRSHRRRRPAV